METITWLALFICFVTYANSADPNVFDTKYLDTLHHDLQQIDATQKAALIADANKANEGAWPSLLLSQFLDANRSVYEHATTARTRRLQELVIGELLTNSGKYMHQIANGLWLKLEESTWVYPADLQKAGHVLPDPGEHLNVTDPFNVESARLMAFIRLTLGDKLNKINKMFEKRIDYELKHRIGKDFSAVLSESGLKPLELLLKKALVMEFN